MNLSQEMEIFAGGPGSGCHGGNCGRPRNKDEEKQAKAKATYIPSTAAKQAQAEKNEKSVAKAIGGQWMSDHKPFDVIHSGKRIGIEVKTKIDGKKHAITMHPKSLERKLKEAKKMKLSATYTVILDDRPGQNKIYYAKGLGSFRIKLKDGSQNPNVIEVKSLKALRKVL